MIPKELSFEEKIFQTQEQLKEVIAQSGLNVSVLELIVRNLYNEVKELALQNLQNKIRESNERFKNAMKEWGDQIKQAEEAKKSEDVEDGNTNEEGTTSSI